MAYSLKKNKQPQFNLLIVPLLFILFILSNTIPEELLLSGGEYSIIEFLQASIILSCFLFQLKFRKILFRGYSKFSYFVRLFLLFFIFYEEISFVTWSRSDLFRIISNQDEMNLHNAEFLSTPLLNLSIPLFDVTFSMTGYFIIISLSLIFIGYGSFIPFIKRYKFLLFEKQYGFYTTIVLPCLFYTYVLRQVYEPQYQLIDIELCELFLYLLILIDTIFKKSLLIKLINRN